MRVVVQRVVSAKVRVGEETVGEIGKGLFVLLGVAEEDTIKEAEQLAEKLSNLRIMADEDGKMNLSIKDVSASVLVVSQFTLHADTSAGNRPSFMKAADPQLAEDLYGHFIEDLKEKNLNVATGSFGDYMIIEAVLDGPVTITLGT